MNQLEPNTLLQNRYLVGQMIGSGGMGEVYIAVDQRIGGPVVIKRTYFAGDDVLGGGFESEARALGRVRHAIFPKVTDHFVEHGEQFIVMDHVSGDDLSKRIAATGKPFPLSWVMFWADQLLDGVVYLHSNEPPIIHRDIKPQNLRLTDSNNIMLLDFGLSRKGVAKLEGAAPSAPGGFLKPYAPLEQIRGNETSPRSDIYSLAATLYFLLTNTVPADAASRADATLTGVPDPLKPATSLNPEVPQTISAVLQKAMSVSHDQRYKDARSMQRALREAFARMSQEPEGEKTIVMDMPVSVEEAKVDTGSATIPFAAPVPVSPTPADFDATVKYEGEIVPVPDTSKQAQIRTEVMITPDITFDQPQKTAEEPSGFDPGATVPFAAVPNEPQPSGDKTMPIIAVDSVPAPIPDQTMPIIAGSGGTVPEKTFENFSDTTDFTATAGVVQATPENTPPPGPTAPIGTAASSVAPGTGTAKKKTSKLLLVGILVGLFVLGLLGAGGIGLAWYLSSGGELPFGTTLTPTPSPAVTPTPEPSPSPSPEGNSNANVQIDASPTPTQTPEPTPVSEVTPDRPSTPVTRPTTAPPTPRQTPITAPTQRPTVKPTVKPTTKPTLRGREIPQ